MVQAELARSSESIGESFAEMDLKTLVPLGVLAVPGMAIAASVGVGLAKAVPNSLDPTGRLDAVAIGLGALVAAAGGMAFLPGYLSSPLAVGATIVVGLAALGVVVGLDTSTVDNGYFRRVITSADASGVTAAKLSSPSGCTTCGPSPANQPATIPPGTGEVREIGQGKAAAGFR